MNPERPRSSKPAVDKRTVLASVVLACVSVAATALAQEVGVGARAPELGVADLDGRTVTIAGLRGRVVLVDFMASWCEPCATSMPVYQRLYTRYEPQGLTIVAVSQDRSLDNARQFAARHHLTFPVLFDGSHAIANRYHPGRMPTAFLIDRGGIVRHVHGGYTSSSGAQIEAQIQALLAAR